MKRFFILLLIGFFSICSNAQDNIETKKITEDACECASKIDISIKQEKRYEQVNQCIEVAITSFQLKSSLLGLTEKTKDTLSKIVDKEKMDTLNIPQEVDIVINPTKDYKTIEENLLQNCPAMKLIMGNSETVNETSLSNKKKAMKFYDEGQAYFRKGQFGNAVVEFNKAVKKDKNFAFAWDMLGYSYRKLENYKKAVECYDKSLKVDPMGKMPLMNKPIAYELMQDIDNAILGYLDFIEKYPKDAEGYYGIGRMYHIKGNYEKALDNTMNAYILYNKVKSPYARDAERNLALFYNELKDQNNLELFNKMAKKYNIEIN